MQVLSHPLRHNYTAPSAVHALYTAIMAGETLPNCGRTTQWGQQAALRRIFAELRGLTSAEIGAMSRPYPDLGRTPPRMGTYDWLPRQ